jgi:hypothetical protein
LVSFVSLNPNVLDVPQWDGMSRPDTSKLLWEFLGLFRKHEAIEKKVDNQLLAFQAWEYIVSPLFFILQVDIAFIVEMIRERRCNYLSLIDHAWIGS